VERAAVLSSVAAAEAAALEVSDVFARLGSGTGGLTADEAGRRLRAVGPNAVRSYRARAWPVLLSQLRSPLLLLLAVAALASAFLGQGSDAVIIGVILVASVGLGFSMSTRRRRPPRRCIRASVTAA
jgi:Mg2+-importing ATPase